MYCPYCKSENIGCIDSKSNYKHFNKNYRRRRYRCNNCNEKFSTFEMPVSYEDIKYVEIGGGYSSITYKDVKEPSKFRNPAPAT